jgi:hypothetical protein
MYLPLPGHAGLAGDTGNGCQCAVTYPICSTIEVRGGEEGVERGLVLDACVVRGHSDHAHDDSDDSGVQVPTTGRRHEGSSQGLQQRYHVHESGRNELSTHTYTHTMDLHHVCSVRYRRTPLNAVGTQAGWEPIRH